MKQHSSFWHLVWYECRKAFFTPVMLVFLAVLLLSNGWKIANSFQRADEFQEYDDVYSMFYDGYLGEITEEKKTHLMTIYAPLEDKAQNMALSDLYDPDAYTYSEATDYAFFLNLFYRQMSYDWSYGDEAASRAEEAHAIREIFARAGNAYETNRFRALQQTFENRQLPEFAETWSWEVLLSHDYSAMIVLLLSIFALSGVFVSERETDMVMLLRTTKKGSDTTVAAKLLTAALFTVTVCMLFFGEDFLIVYLMSGRTQALSSPCYVLEYFRLTPLNLTLGQYFLWAAVMKTLGMFFCGCIILLISSLCQQMLSAFFASFVVLAGCVVLQEFSGYALGLKAFNPMELVMARKLVKKCAFWNFFGTAVPLHILALLGSALLAVILLGGVIYANRSFHRRRRRRAHHG